MNNLRIYECVIAQLSRGSSAERKGFVSNAASLKMPDGEVLNVGGSLDRSSDRGEPTEVSDEEDEDVDVESESGKFAFSRLQIKCY